MKRIGLAILALSSGPLGLWATLAPHNFYETFPGGGHHWVRMDGPYNHHLVTDFGAATLAITVVTIGALVWMTPQLVKLTAVAWLFYAVPHEWYHATHLKPFSTGDKVGTLVGLGVDVVIAILLLLPFPDPVTHATANEGANSS